MIMQVNLFSQNTKTKKKSWKKNNKPSFSFIDLFAGIGGFRVALENHGGKCVFSSEWDKNSQTTYYNNFGDVPSGDITKIKENKVPAHDILCGGFPCQAFSISGKRLGFNDTRGTLFFDVARIAAKKRPKVLFLENVKNFEKHEGGKTLQVIKDTLNEIGYPYDKQFIKVLKSSNFEVPQARERIYIIAFRKDLKINKFEFPKPHKITKVVADILEKEKDVKIKYIVRNDIKIYKDEKDLIDLRKPFQIGKINKGGQGERIYSTKAAGITLSAYGGGAASKTGAYLINGKIRKLTPRECARIQGYPDDFEIHTNLNICYKQFGDSVSVPVLINIFKQIIKAYPKIKKYVE